jgi:hypothetical protein
MDIDESRRGENPFDEPVSRLREADPAQVAARAGASWQPDAEGAGRIILPALNGELEVTFPEVSVSGPKQLASFSMKLLALLYLASGDGSDPSGKWVAYRELQGGRFYEPVVARSIEEPLAARFGKDPDAFLEACKAFGGRPTGLGDSSCTFDLFPKVLMSFILWRADEEFDARVQVLFDSASIKNLNAFDLRMGAQEVSTRMLKWTGEGA